MSNGVNERFDFSAALPGLDEVERVHFIAVGGSGMSGIARLMRARGLQVSGSDNVEVPVLAKLAQDGIAITVGYSEQTADALPDGTLVVISTAIKEDNPELLRVRERGLPVLHRAQGLAMVLSGRRGLAVAGANGKTTTSGMATAALRALERDPSFAIGAEIVGVGSNSAVGAGDDFVVEADESDGSFVVYHPQVAIVTSVKDDHLDFYGSTEHLVAAYREFALTVDPDGLLVCCADDPGSAALGNWAADQGRRVLTYGTHEQADMRISKLTEHGWSGRCVLRDLDGEHHNLQVNVPGVHNLENAAGVVTALVYGLGVSMPDAVASVAAFHGTSRRAELRGEVGGIRVVDDYAHNRGKLEAMVRTGRHLRGEGRLIVVFQPHLYSRTRDQAVGMAAALDGVDVAIVMDVYGAREAPMPGVSSDLIAAAMTRPCTRTHSAEETVDLVLATARPGDLVVTVGAGDVTHLGPQILQRLEASTSTQD
ncbi:UDP-N-acetylmuramate--L-alanine ligase [Yimella sp. cx-573]|nr:UDP-N-acetylmuramate--L-alanine ligase [Yimella sp. cx-573]